VLPADDPDFATATMQARRGKMSSLDHLMNCGSGSSGPSPRSASASRSRFLTSTFATAIFASSAVLVGSQTTESAGGWIQRSDAFAARLIQLEERLRPETAVSNPELDDQVSDLSTDSLVRAMAAFRRLRDEVVRQHAHEKDPDVRQDLGVLIERVKNRIRGIELDSA
jgi:hypothetical protein